MGFFNSVGKWFKKAGKKTGETLAEAVDGAG